MQMNNNIRARLTRNELNIISALEDAFEIPAQPLNDDATTGNSIYYYGSVLRLDYFPGKSDVDVTIFTDDELTAQSTVCMILKISEDESDDMQRIVRVYTPPHQPNNKIILYGYKVKYNDAKRQTHLEISIYNNVFKPYVIERMQNGQQLGMFWVLLSMVLKYFYYVIPLLSKNMFNSIKNGVIFSHTEFAVF